MIRAVLLSVLLATVAIGDVWPQSSQAGQQRGDTRRWYEAYEEGRQAIAKQDWSAAIAHLDAAKALRSGQGRRVLFYSNLFDAYIPDYLLGVAYLRLGRYADAEAAFGNVDTLKLLVEGDKEYDTFQAQWTSARFEARLQRAEALAKGGNPGQAAEELAAARNIGGDQARLNAVLDLITKAQTVEVEPAEPTVIARNGPPPTGPPPSTPAPTPNESPAAATPTVPTPTPSPTAAPTRPPPAPPQGPSPEVTERTAITAFFSGNYDFAARALSALTLVSDTPRARFYLACSLAALVITGDRPVSSLTDAREHLLRAGSIGPFAGDRRLISPRILQLLGVRS